MGPGTVHTDHNLVSWSSVVEVSTEVVDVASQFAVGGHMLKCTTAAEFPPTVFKLVQVYAYHSSENLVRRTIEVNGLSEPIYILWSGLAI